MEKKECDYGHWQVSSLPCKHVVWCIDTIKADIEDFIDLFKEKASLNTCNEQLSPISNVIIWPLVVHNDVQPLNVIRQVGKPKMAKRWVVNELQPIKRSCSVRCNACSEWGQDKRTCVLGQKQ